ncbi:MAG TPA: DUF4760 domain-containing protein [Nitrososphaeraceae archaeon]|jgi:hypothetical protein
MANSRIGSRKSTKSISKKNKRAIKKTASFEDINMLFKITELYNTDYDFQASEWFWSKLHKDEIPPSIDEFESKFPQGSKEFQLFERFTSKFELSGLLIEYGFLDENIYFDRYGGLQKEWEIAKPIIYGIRKQWDNPHFRENFEILAIRGKSWIESHSSKIKDNKIQ